MVLRETKFFHFVGSFGLQLHFQGRDFGLLRRESRLLLIETIFKLIKLLVVQENLATLVDILVFVSTVILHQREETAAAFAWIMGHTLISNLKLLICI